MSLVTNRKPTYFVSLPIMLASILLLSMPGGMEWVLIFVVVLLMFGGKKIPELMQGLGKGIRDFNDAKDKVKENLEEGMKPKDTTATTSEKGNPIV